MKPQVQFYKLRYFDGGVPRLEDIKIRAESFEDAFQNNEKYLKALGNDTKNVFITLAQCSEVKKANKNGKLIDRFIEVQKHITFDIDDINVKKKEETLAAARRALGLEHDEGYAVFTGHGIHIHVTLKNAITTEQYFEDHREQYKLWAKRIDLELKRTGLPGKCDPSVFKNTQLVRFTGTINHKPSRPAVVCEYMNGTFKVPKNVDFFEKLETEHVLEHETYLSKKAYKKLYYAIDKDAVLSGCESIKQAISDPDSIDEPLWYALLGVTAFLPDGDNVSHEVSRKYSKYSYDETQLKIEQVKTNQTGPSLCRTIESRGGPCDKCVNKGKVSCPVQIRGENFIKTATTGFREIAYNEDGSLRQKRPVNYQDLLKHFENTHPFKSVDYGARTGVYIYNGKHWELTGTNYTKSFAENHIDPLPKTHEVYEFHCKVLRNNYEKPEWLEQPTAQGLINFENGVLDLYTNELMEHSPDFNFHNIFPYRFIEAECPRVDKVLSELFSDHKDAIEFFWRYLGACFDPYGSLEKALFLIGRPGTGKSTILEIFRSVFDGNVRSNLSVSDICDINLFRFKSHNLYKKFVNISDEGVPKKALDSANFKAVVSGADIAHERKNQDAFFFKCYAKLVIAANEMLTLQDSSVNLARKFEILMFDNVIPPEDRNPDVKTIWIPEEREGIAYKAISKYREMISEYKKTARWELKRTRQMAQAKQKSLKNADYTENFLSCLVIDPDSFQSSKDLYLMYTRWCEENGHYYKKTKPQFFQLFTNHFTPSQLNKIQVRRYVEGTRLRGYTLAFVDEDGEKVEDPY